MIRSMTIPAVLLAALASVAAAGPVSGGIGTDIVSRPSGSHGRVFHEPIQKNCGTCAGKFGWRNSRLVDSLVAAPRAGKCEQ